MSAFDYLALDIRGKKSRGVIEADNDRAARALLKSMSLVPLKLETNRVSDPNASNPFWQLRISSSPENS
jgi:type II secretory pathway component PulF